jgi:hypothetical protein
VVKVFQLIIDEKPPDSRMYEPGGFSSLRILRCCAEASSCGV